MSILTTYINGGEIYKTGNHIVTPTDVLISTGSNGLKSTYKYVDRTINKDSFVFWEGHKQDPETGSSYTKQYFSSIELAKLMRFPVPIIKLNTEQLKNLNTIKSKLSSCLILGYASYSNSDSIQVYFSTSSESLKSICSRLDAVFPLNDELVESYDSDPKTWKFRMLMKKPIIVSSAKLENDGTVTVLTYRFHKEQLS